MVNRVDEARPDSVRHRPVWNDGRIVHRRTQRLQIAGMKRLVYPLELFRLGAAFLVGGHDEVDPRANRSESRVLTLPPAIVPGAAILQARPR